MVTSVRQKRQELLEEVGKMQASLMSGCSSGRQPVATSPMICSHLVLNVCASNESAVTAAVGWTLMQEVKLKPGI